MIHRLHVVGKESLVMDISFEFLTYARKHGDDMNGILRGPKEEAFKRWYNEVYLKQEVYLKK